MTGIITALNEELAPVLEKMTDTVCETVSGLTFTTGMLGSQKVTAAVCGIGKVNAAICAQIMITRFGAEQVINTGIGGMLDPSLRQCDLVVGSGFVQHDFDIHDIDNVEPGYVPGPDCIIIKPDEKLFDLISGVCRELHPDRAHEGIIASGDQFIADRKIADGIRERFGADVCDMESSSMAHVCKLAGVPFAAVRCISDSADDAEYNTYFEFRDAAARMSAELICAAVERM